MVKHNREVSVLANRGFWSYQRILNIQTRCLWCSLHFRPTCTCAIRMLSGIQL